MKLNPYLNFENRSEEALNFYAKALGGKITALHRFGEAPFPCADAAKNLVMHGCVEFGDNRLMLSDSNGSDGCGPGVPGTNISLSLNLTGDTGEADKVFDALSAGGKIIMPMQKQFWGAYFGMTSDRFGIQWMVNCEPGTLTPSKPLD